jgi:glycosyltransferase involved in cell wall biosynthesis
VAQAFGVPIVASAIGAMQDVVEHDVSGALVAAEDTAALARTITALIADPERAKRLGQRALQDAEGPFAWTTIARTILDAV